ncbi:MAG: Hpt domain-containing protein [Saprospiraceae bacterium]
MELNWDTTYIDPQNIIGISRGDESRMIKYLNQFLELMPPRIENLKERLQADDRKMIRQILHQMSPQLQFFGIPGVLTPIRRLEHEYDTMPLAELKALVNDLLQKLDGASQEVTLVLKNNFGKE